jgi:hypothetical protein
MSGRLLVVVIGVLAVVGAAPAIAATSSDDQLGRGLLAQEEETEGQDTGGTEEETGAGQGETQQAPPETGPPWTFQMARIGGGLVLLLLAGIGWWYYRFIVKRQRGEI